MANVTCLLCSCTQQESLLKPFVRFVLNCAFRSLNGSLQQTKEDEAALKYLKTEITK